MSQQPVYGFPCVSDPNDFDPDPELCSQAEIAAHQLAVKTFGTPDYEPNKGCYTETDTDGRLVKHVLRTSWGIGTNLIASCDGCREPFFDADAKPITCFDCHEQEFCETCWPEHEKRHEIGDLS